MAIRNTEAKGVRAKTHRILWTYKEVVGATPVLSYLLPGYDAGDIVKSADDLNCENQE